MAASPPLSARTPTSPTADEHVLPEGTAYITDVGMTGPHEGIIGMERTAIIKKFIDGLAHAL